MAARFLRLAEQDDVVVALTDLAPGEPLPGGVTARDAVTAGHKLALRSIAEDEPVRKLGQTIGFASRPILAGEHVHLHNLDGRPFPRAAAGTRSLRAPLVARAPRFFDGFVRQDGSVATRNYVGVITTVNCSATVCRGIGARATQWLSRFPHVDGVAVLAHRSGCGLATGEGAAVLERTLAGFLRHPSFAGVLLVGLGCEMTPIESVLSRARLAPSERLRVLGIQDAGGTLAAIDAGAQQVEELLQLAERARRTSVPASALRLGLKCGGSDAYSGVSANPVLGAAADLLVAQGGTIILSETPEIYGAEHLLAERAVSDDVRAKLAERVAWWEAHLARNGAEMNNNPSPGNKAGGLTTIYEKSLGAIAKSGSSPLVAVREYAELIEEAGFVFMDSPGYDPCTVTGQVAAGANIICFTTGRGSVFGCKPAPTLKLASNAELMRKMADDMDFGCGAVLSGEASVEALGAELFELVLQTASGKPTKSELLGVGDEEFVPWTPGAMV